jgi:putative glutamine amidotransferase
MSERLPRIGISCDFEAVNDCRGSPSPRYILQESYVTAVARAGGQPWLVAHLPPEQANSVLDMLDGIVLSGGNFDVPPAYYGEEARHVNGTCEARSAFERALVLAAYERGVPMLGVCGGLQIINVALGGSLHQDVSEKPGCLGHSQPFDKRRPHHCVTIIPGSLLARITGCEVLQVNSTHHQVTKAVGRGLVATATATDGAIEAIEAVEASEAAEAGDATETGAAGLAGQDTDATAADEASTGNDGSRLGAVRPYARAPRFLLGVQWHPEAMQHEAAHHAIYRGLVGAAREHRDRGGHESFP